MKKFNRDDRSDDKRGGKKFGSRDFGNRSFGGRTEMYQAVCGKCGQECEVPFRPTGDRPVFCNNCFERPEPKSFGRSGGRDFKRPSFGPKPMFQAVCSKCSQKCEVPFRPTGDKPVYCSDCFSKSGNKGGSTGGNRGGDQFKEQLDALNSKLDKLIKALLPAEAKSPEKKEAKKPVEAKAPAIAKKVTKKKPAAKKAKK